jgi:pimeloyl-ACP methyl ester carboxylesterase
VTTTPTGGDAGDGLGAGLEPDPADPSPDLPGTSAFVDAGAVRLHARVAGPVDGPLVVLLHGFPEFWYGWHRLLDPLADAGYRVVAPDGRGYNRSAKPDGVPPYRMDALGGDVLGVLDALDRESARVVGHDWGAAVGWWLALERPDRVDRLAALNVPHLAAFEAALRSSPEQLLRSWYVAAFQVPVLPEAISRLGNYRAMTRGLVDSSRPGTFSEADLDRYRRAWDRPGALTGMVNWYRAVARYGSRTDRERVAPETLVLWGARDRFLTRSLADDSLAFCENGRLRVLEDATHWLHHEVPGVVADELLGFLDGRAGA